MIFSILLAIVASVVTSSVHTFLSNDKALRKLNEAHQAEIQDQCKSAYELGWKAASEDVDNARKSYLKIFSDTIV